MEGWNELPSEDAILHPDDRGHLNDWFRLDAFGQLTLADISVIWNILATDEHLLFSLNMAGNRSSLHLQEGKQRALTFCNLSLEKQKAS